MKKIILLVTIVFVSVTGFSQSSLWTKANETRLNVLEKTERGSTPTKYQLYSLDYAGLKNMLLTAPARESGVESTLVIPFPNAKGVLQNYKIYEASVMEPELAEKHQEIQSYVGQGIDDPTASIHFTTTIFGLHTMTLSGNGTFYIDPYTKDLQNYIVYDKSDLTSKRTFECLSRHSEETPKRPESLNQIMASDGRFRTYRLAMACTFEYATFHINAANLGAGNETQKKGAVLAAMNVTVSRMNSAYERDMSLRLVLVANNTNIIYVTSADPFNNNNPNTLINQSQSTITSVIGTANFDIGHTVSTGGGGLASPGVCVPNLKASGITGSPSPVGDPFDIDYVAHEVGHQFGANHTFNGDGENCVSTPANQATINLSTAVEPGSGSTIMAYAGICSPVNVQSNSDSYFHAVSIAEMVSFIATYTCVPGTPNNNAAPAIAAITNYTIPKGTPFALTGNATDADGDALTYCWEQVDTGTNRANPSATTTGRNPNFRSFSPSTSPTRYFPSLSEVLNNNLTSTWEVIPNVARTMAFALTVRDNKSPNGGQTSRQNMTVTTNAATGPFNVTSQNTDNISWTQGSTQTITWNIAGTNAAPINTANVKISLSTDGGLTYPTVLTASTPNDGNENITVPNVAAPFCRIKIEAIGNIYYAINTKTFAIGYTVTNVCTSYFNNTPFNVSDGTGSNSAVYGTTAQSIINVPASTDTISDIKITVNGSHPDISDWIIGVVHPDNTQRIFWGHNCYVPSNLVTGLNASFKDGSPALTCTSPTTSGTFAPLQAFSTLTGKPKEGNWRLIAADGYSTQTGTINSWSIEICSMTAVLNTETISVMNFKIYPNPNKGNFTVKFDNASSNEINIVIHDLSGRQILNKAYTNTGNFSQDLQLNNIQAGIYLVTVQDGNRKETKKIVVE